MLISWMFITPSFKKSLIVEQFQGNYLKCLRNGFWIVTVHKIPKKCLSHSGKMHFSVSGHVTLGVVRWRHELDYICSLRVLSSHPGQVDSSSGQVIFHSHLILTELYLYKNDFCTLIVALIILSILSSNLVHNPATFLALNFHCV